MPDSRRGSHRGRWFRAGRASRACQRESGVRAGEPLIPLLDEAVGRAEVDTLLAQGKYVYAVRRVRQLTGLSLADAKRLADTLEWQSGRRLRPPGGEQLPAWVRDVFQEVAQHRWWRLSLVTVIPANGAAWFIPALHGWPRDTIQGLWLLFLLGFYVDLAITYRRHRRAPRDRAQ
ncbi:MAG: hypothetical protein J2P28_17580 [Actinobacteria bacterium]|nr:hypothetical protein [Actinomycetota bacterium]